jgi:nitrite reductase (cytochrome c-552)
MCLIPPKSRLPKGVPQMSDKKILFSMIAVSLFLAVTGCSSDSSDPSTPTYKTKLASTEIRNSAFKEAFPLHYETYLRNNESEIMTEYGGSVAYNKNDNVNPLPEGYKHAQPYLKNLWLGYPFSYEYRAARGHTYAMQDILHIDRINRYDEQAGLPSTCWNCKTAKMNEWVGEYGDEFWAKNFNQFREAVDPHEDTIGCANCHDPANMELRLYSVPLKAYLEEQGKEFTSLSRNEQRALVCGQCHVEYYFQDKGFGPAKKPVFPWSEPGTGIHLLRHPWRHHHSRF